MRGFSNPASAGAISPASAGNLRPSVPSPVIRGNFQRFGTSPPMRVITRRKYTVADRDRLLQPPAQFEVAGARCISGNGARRSRREDPAAADSPDFACPPASPSSGRQRLVRPLEDFP